MSIRLALPALLTLAFAAPARAAMPASSHESHDNDLHSYLRADRLEYWNGDAGPGLAWEVSGWLGTDLDRLWLRTEGERAGGALDSADAELLYGHSISTWWDVVAGLRQDFRPRDGRSWAAFGIQGLAPQRLEITVTAYLGANQRTAARLETAYPLLLTNRLVLQSMLEVWWYGRDDATRGIGSGLATAQAGLRLRYEFTRRFAPYIGVAYEHAFADTASLRQGTAADVAGVRFVAGLRTWF